MENAVNGYYRLSWRERIGFCSGDLASLRRHPIGRICHALFLERVQRVAALCLRYLCGTVHVFHPNQRSLWRTRLVTHT